MKKLVRNSMLVGAAVLGIGSLGAVAQAAAQHLHHQLQEQPRPILRLERSL
ncbi:hypothetical protein [Companilactobacillus paralimentarius]|uniref:hypothetical protein n=1 Tax=Companilactobacillus paralimentarius TaxID=83526 RepID=UPI00384E23CA